MYLMDLFIGGIALVVWLLVMVPAAFVCFGSSDPTTTLDRLPDNLTQLPRPEPRTDDDRLAA